MNAAAAEPELREWAQEIAARHSVALGREVRRTTHDVHDGLRNLMYEAEFRGRPAVLKLYDGDVVSVEADSLRQFHAANRSAVLTAPQLYLGENVSFTRGWLLTERLPPDGAFLDSPLDQAERQRFIELFLEYRANFPRHQNRPLALPESGDAFSFHLFRLMQALDKASTREQQRAFAGEPEVVDRDALFSRLGGVLDRLRAVFGRRPLHWGHGHFNPNELYAFQEGERWAITDFGHTKMLPDGYEPAQAIQWDRMIAAAPLPWQDWLAQIKGWSAAFVERVEGLTPEVMRASLLERSLATLLASLATADDMPPEERSTRCELQYRLIDELL